MREIVLDTETTGLDPATGDRIVEVGAVELLNGVPTGVTYHAYVNPERDMPEAAFRVHGLSTEFLKNHRIFAEVAAEFSAFIADDRLVIHNAEFDVKFINAELARMDMPGLHPDRVLDSLVLARRRHPGAANSLDALCTRYGIDISRRKKHGALLDAELLAEVYIELSGGRQSALALQTAKPRVEQAVLEVQTDRPTALAPAITPEELTTHRALIAALGDRALWLRYKAADQATGVDA